MIYKGSQWVSLATSVGGKLESILSVKVPLSDWALKYISTIWHHPPGRKTRRMSAI